MRTRRSASTTASVGAMQWTDAYATTRQRLLAQAEILDDRAAKAAVPALPGWSVKDAYAHLTGVCADVLAGNLEGGGTSAWTARQVAERAERPLVSVCAEWSDRGAEIDGWVAAAEDRAAFVCFDVWSHEQDIRGAVGLAGDRDDERAHYLVAKALETFDRRVTDAGVPAVRVVTETLDRVVGAGDPAASLHTVDYELLRILFSRRSRAQILRADWEGDPQPSLGPLHLFDLPVSDLAD